MNTNLNDYKERVKRLRKAVSSVLNIECTQSQAYELMAQEENYPNWDTLSGSINKVEPKQENNILTPKEQIVQLLLIYEGLRNCYPLFEILPLLKEQKNPIINKGWSNVDIPNNEDFSDILAQTKFFGDDVLAILKMSSRTGILEDGIKSAIEFLKLGLI